MVGLGCALNDWDGLCPEKLVLVILSINILVLALLECVETKMLVYRVQNPFKKNDISAGNLQFRSNVHGHARPCTLELNSYGNQVQSAKDYYLRLLARCLTSFQTWQNRKSQTIDRARRVILRSPRFPQGRSTRRTGESRRRLM
jgi:hypothetical protein